MRGGLIFPREGQPAEVQGIRSEAADGIRTHDLLHGKSDSAFRLFAPVRVFRFTERNPAKRELSACGCFRACC
jgi:hypothetical protein